MYKNLFELEIINSEKSEKFVVNWVEVESPTGNFIIGPGHDNLISIIESKSKLKYKKRDNLISEIDIYDGMIEISSGKATVLLG